MKKLLYLLTGILLAAFILPSCGSSYSITKRRYTKGYYVDRSPGKQSTPKVHHRAAGQNSALATAEEQEAFRAIEYVKKPETNVSRPEKITTASAATPVKARKIITAKNDVAPVELAFKNPVKAFRLASDLTKQAAAQDDALSLIWILLVVLLVIYILGALNDGFGLGNLIHLLAVILVVMLILWLLRII